MHLNDSITIDTTPTRRLTVGSVCVGENGTLFTIQRATDGELFAESLDYHNVWSLEEVGSFAVLIRGDSLLEVIKDLRQRAAEPRG